MRRESKDIRRSVARRRLIVKGIVIRYLRRRLTSRTEVLGQQPHFVHCAVVTLVRYNYIFRKTNGIARVQTCSSLFGALQDYDRRGMLVKSP